MAWKIKTHSETPFLFTPGASGMAGTPIAFDIEGLPSGNWWVSGLCDLGDSPRTFKYWWQAETAFQQSPLAGTFVNFYAATMDDGDLTNMDGLPVASGDLPETGNYGIVPGGGVSVSGSPFPLPFTLQVQTKNLDCSCLNGSFALNWTASLGLWQSTAITCSGGQPAYLQLRLPGSGLAQFGVAAAGSTIGGGISSMGSGHIMSYAPFDAQDYGTGFYQGNLFTWCTQVSNSGNWTVTGGSTVVPAINNLEYVGSIATDGKGRNVTSGYVEFESRYLYLLAYNGTKTSLSPSGAQHQFYLLPVPDEVVNA